MPPMSKNTSIISILSVISLILAGCAVWRFAKSKIPTPVVCERTQKFLKSDFSLELTNSWRIVNASGGIVGTPLYVRMWREYFLQGEGDFTAYNVLSNQLGSRHWTTDYSFIPPGYGNTIMSHGASAKIAPWWRPETNLEPRLFASLNNNGRIVYIYSFEKTTNALIYLHVIENRE
jgi:hypothetical protein